MFAHSIFRLLDNKPNTSQASTSAIHRFHWINHPVAARSLLGCAACHLQRTFYTCQGRLIHTNAPAQHFSRQTGQLWCDMMARFIELLPNTQAVLEAIIVHVVKDIILVINPGATNNLQHPGRACLISLAK